MSEEKKANGEATTQKAAAGGGGMPKPKFFIQGVPFFWGGENRRLLTEAAIQFKFRPDDILVAGFPRSGTTFRRQLIWLVANNADVESAKKVILRHRVPGLDRFSTDEGEKSAIDMANSIEGGRVLFTHLPYNLMKESVEAAGIKVICLLRNPKDVVVSSFHASKYFLPVLGAEFANPTMDMAVKFMSANGDRGNMLDHNMSYWRERNNPKFLMLFFEEVRKDYNAAVQKVAAFMEKDISKEQEDKIVEFINFSAFQKHQEKESKASNKLRDHTIKHGHVRKGEVGDWKNYFSVAQNEFFDRVIANRTKDDPIPFEYE